MREYPATESELDLADERGRYHRQGLIHWWDQERLSKARILVAGAGALGNEIVKNLVLVGVGNVTVADMDHIEGSNLARCVFFRTEDEGLPKAQVLAQRAQELNPEVSVEPIVGDIRAECGLGSFLDYDLVIGGLDNREARLFINQACWKTSTPWIDGAIEGLMGVVKLFVPPDTACYECTMGEKDYELIARRRACTLLSQEEMLEGKIPTTATTSSVVAGIQVQEAIKLLHEDRLGGSTLSGGGLHFVGLTHDSYTVTYSRDKDCLSHETYDFVDLESVSSGDSFTQILEQLDVGAEAVVELQHEIAVEGVCTGCSHSGEVMTMVERAGSGAGLCPRCGEGWQLTFAHLVEPNSRLADLSPDQLGLPSDDILVVRDGAEMRFLRTS